MRKGKGNFPAVRSGIAFRKIIITLPPDLSPCNMTSTPASKKSALIAFCAPFVVFMLFLGLADFIESLKLEPFHLAQPRYWLYPLQTVVCAALLFFYRRHYQFAWPKTGRNWTYTVVIAVLVLGIWISPQELFGLAPRTDGFDPSLFKDQPTAYWGTLFFRFLRLVVVVPFLEEIFWRGFLLRYLIKEDFESVTPGTYTLFSFSAVSILFGLAHWGPDFWPAVITGALYNIIMLRTRSLGACVIAHGITNLLLGLYIMRTGQWGFW